MSNETLPAVRDGTARHPAPASPLAVTSLSDLLTLGKVLAESGFFADARGASQAVAKILAGRELGFQTIASMVGVHIIEGKPSIGAHLLAAAIKRSGRYDYRVLRCDREACELEFLSLREGKWEALGRTAMSLREAVESGLAVGRDGKAKANWARSPDDMLFARCVSKGYRRYCPDLTGGVLVYDPDELDKEPPAAACAPTGEVADASYTMADGTYVGMDETLPPPSANGVQEAPRPNPSAPAPTEKPAPGKITEQERQMLATLYRDHGRTQEEMPAILAALGIKAMDQLPRERLERARQLLIQGPATTAQTDRIAKLIEAAGVPWEKAAERLREKYGATSFAHLTRTEADGIEAAFRHAAGRTAPAA